MMETATKPRLRLTGRDGNSFVLLGAAWNAAKKAKWSEERWQAVKNEAMSGDHDNLIQVLMEHFDVS